MNPAQAASGRSRALLPSGLLLTGGVLVVLGALVGTAHTFDRSALGSVPVAVAVVLLPALVALAASGRRASLALGLCAGAGMLGIARFLTDLGVLTSPTTAVRPELFYELSIRAQPFTAAAGIGVLLAGDVVLVAAGAIAAKALADLLALASEPIFDPPLPAAEPEHGPELLARAWDAEATEPAGRASAVDAGDGTENADPAGRNNGLIVAGFVGVLLLLGGSLGLAYRGGYLAARYLPPELGLMGIFGALATAVIATIAVLVAAALPRALAAALLGGVALAAAVPLLTALVVRVAGAPVQLTAAVPIGLAGAVVLAAAGLLGNSTPLPPGDDVPSRSGVRRTDLIGAALSLLTAVAGAAAWRLPQLHYNGGADPVLAGGYAISSPLAAPFLVAAIVPLVAGVLWLVPWRSEDDVGAVSGAGRVIATIGWLPLVFAATQTLALLGQLVASASVPNAEFASPRWTAGPGLWCAVGGIVSGIGAAVVSVIAGRQAREASARFPEEESLTRSRMRGAFGAGVLAVVTVVALALPVYRTTTTRSPTLLVGLGVDSWGVVALGIGIIAAVVAAGRASRASAAFTFPLAAAALMGTRLVIPAAVQAQDGFAVEGGLFVGGAAVVLFLVGAVVGARSTAGVEFIEPDRIAPLPASTPARRASKPASDGRKPSGKRPAAGASSSKAAKGRSS